MVEHPPEPEGPGGVYIHIPFCSRRCSYCDFATVAGRDDVLPPYLEALRREIESFQPGAHETVDTVFFGGGTPSRLSGEQVSDLLRTVRNRFHVLPGAEITMESNPEDLTAGVLTGFREAGIGRITVGVQSLDPGVLQAVGRGHDGARALQAVEDAGRAGIGQVAVDLIAGLPGEEPDGWQETLNRLIAVDPDHFSVYLLETDKDSPLSRSMQAGRTAYPEDDVLADAWEQTTNHLGAAGDLQYEISNYARPGKACRHNLKYWQDLPYAGFGLGAHAYHRGERRGNRKDLDGYCADLTVGRDPVAEWDRWHPVRRLEEALFMGLRLNEGIDADRIGARYGLDLQEAYRSVWEKAEEQCLVVRNGSRIRLTRAGQLRSNVVFRWLLHHLPVK